jgi:precorrin-6A/cobalt-precorrin-6A reductase
VGPGPTEPGPTEPGPTEPGPTEPGPTEPGLPDPGHLPLVLVIGGTGEARDLAAALHQRPGLRVLSSLAGAVARPRLPVGPVRVGGFGGPEGLRAWLGEHLPAAVVDASHPFAARISASCALACRAAGTPLLRLERPAWSARDGDRWYPATDVPAAAALAARLGRRILVTTGRRDLAAFAALPPADLSILARCVDPPRPPPPAPIEVLLDRGPYTVHGERSLLRERSIEVLVTKNSGGAMVGAKLTAARDLGLPVVMVDRPAAPPDPAPAVGDSAAAAAWVERVISLAARVL